MQALRATEPRSFQFVGGRCTSAQTLPGSHSGRCVWTPRTPRTAPRSAAGASYLRLLTKLFLAKSAAKHSQSSMSKVAIERLENEENSTKIKGKARAAPASSDEGERPVKRRRTESPTAAGATVVHYDAPAAFQETHLYAQLQRLDSSGSLQRFRKYARKVYVDLGPCAADLLWRKALLGTALKADDDNLASLRKVVQEWEFELPNAFSNSPRCNLSPQLLKLVEVLRSFDMHSKEFRGIVLVKRPTTAMMLATILRLLDEDLPHVRPIAVTALNILGIDQDESALVESFCLGFHNLLIANKIDETLVLPTITAVIHYNLVEDVRLRSTQSPADWSAGPKIVYLAEHGNDVRKNSMGSPSQYPTQALAALDVDSACPDVAMTDDEDEKLEFVYEPATGKRIEARLAPLALQRYLDWIQKLLLPDDSDKPAPWCTLESLGDQGPILHLNIPPKLPIPGPLRRLADRCREGATPRQCLTTCKQLFDAGLLKDEFFFAHGEIDDAAVSPMAGHEVKKANQSASTRCYLRKQPTFWSRALQSTSSHIYPLVISIDSDDSSAKFQSQPYGSLLILTRLPLPNFEAFPVFCDGNKAFVRLRQGAPFTLDEEKQEALLRYTLRLARALTNKPLECSAAEILYYLAPLDDGWCSTPSDSPPWRPQEVHRYIAWNRVAEAAERWAVKLTPDDGTLTEEAVQDCVIQDRAVEFTNRHYVLKLRRDLSPHSEMKSDSAEEVRVSYIDYCKSHVKDFTGLKDENQPLIECSLAPPVSNHLTPTSKAALMKNFTRMFIPELCYRFVVPASTWRTALLLPSITHMLDRMLLVKEMGVSLFDETIGECELMQAVTPVSANVEKNYERLELLGDTLLKKVLSTYFFVKMPLKREGALNSARSQAVSNRTLHENAMAAGLPPWIQSKPMAVKLWAPFSLSPNENITSDTPNKGSSGVQKADGPRRSKQQKQLEEQTHQWLGDKTVADVVEAIVGAAYHHGGMCNVLRVMKRLHFNMPEITGWSDFWRSYASSVPSQETPCNLSPSTIEAVQELTGCRFLRPALVAEALTHGSLSNQESTTYDRLEFLGDGILDFNVAWYIFKAYPNLSPGGLSLLKAAMVSNSTLAVVAVDSGLYKHMRCSSKEMNSSITLYAQKILALRDQEYRDAEAEGRLPNQYWLEVNAPKPVADLVEAVIGAIYVSDHFNTDGVDTFFKKVLQPFYERHIRLHTLATHPSKSLFELLQAEGCQQHTIRKTSITKGTRSEVIVHEQILAGAEAKTPNLALRRAATAALDVLTNNPDWMSQTCDCKSHKSDSKGKRTQKKERQQGYEAGR